MSNVALFEIVLEGTYFGQQIINRWNYVSTSTPAAVSLSFGLFAAFGCQNTGGTPVYDADLPFAKILSIQKQEMAWTQCIVKNVYDLADFYASPFVTGTIGLVVPGEAQSPTIAFGFHSNQTTRAVRRGQKRLAGVNDTYLDPGGTLTPSAQTGAQGVADSWSEVIVYDDEGTELSYAPVIISKEKYTTPSGKFAYRYYPTLSAQLAHAATAISWSIMPQVRTQRSRQYGIGA